MADTSYDDVLARNIRASRVRLGLTQDSLAARMRALGYTVWLRQTVPNVEKGKRRVLATEVFGLAAALEITAPLLMAATDHDGAIAFPAGQSISAASARALATGFNDGAVTWQGDVPGFGAGRRAWFAGDPTAPAAVKAAWEAEDEPGSARG